MTAGVVAAGHDVTVTAAEEILRAGGNAYDAVLGAFLAATVAEPVLASLGGGGFLLALPAGERARVYDFFVHTPRTCRPIDDVDFYAITADFGTATQEFHIGRGTIAVPGAVRGMFAVNRDLGRMPMRDVAAPALEHARTGVAVTDFQAYLLRVVSATFTATPESLAVFGSRERAGELIGAGERLRQPALADALEALAIEGEDLFYRGEIGQTLCRDLAAAGQVSLDDLAGYRVERREPLVVDHRGARIVTNPAPSSGGLLVAFGLRMLDEEEPGALDFGGAEHVDLVARVLELTSEARADAQSDGVHLDGGRLLDPAFLARWRAQVRVRPRARRGTTHISVIDGEGNVAAMTVSNGEGSGYLVPGTGIVMNNMLGEEDLNPGGFQRWAPGRRMSSMMAPSAVMWPDGGLAATGSGGSNRIRTAILQVLVNLVDFRMPVEEAVEASRLHFERGLLSIEGGFDPERIAPVLERHPHHQLWEARNMFFGGAHTVARRRGGFEAAGDPRRGGAARIL